MQIYADILLPIARGAFTFRAGNAIAGCLKEGMGVEVTLGPRKRYMGIVWRIHTEKPPFSNIKEIGEIVMPEILVSAGQRDFWRWIADYYMCTQGDVMRMALPASLKPTGMNEAEFTADTYRPRTEKFLSLSPRIRDTGALNDVFASFGRSKAQYAALVEFCSIVPENGLFDGAEVMRKMMGASETVVKKLLEKDVLVLSQHPLAPESAVKPASMFELPRLTQVQTRALEEIEQGFSTCPCTLLHGVTGSGKTEIYMHMIARMLAGGKTVLYLMPEIVMTSQIVRRVRKVFGDRVIVYHSKLSPARRAEAYLRLSRSNGGELILGVRSSVLLPLPQLGLVVVDEEHDPSFKQNDAAPRYNARDCAVVLGRIYGSKTLLGSATPSIESYQNARSGKYALVTLTERYGGGRLPRIIVSDTLRAVKRGERKAHFNKELLDRLSGVLRDGRQAILFQNRRGFSPYIECTKCGWVAHCPRCSVTLTYHKHSGALQCHYCGYSTPMSPVCPSCGNGGLNIGGFGTEKVEEELQRLFPQARIARLDRDTATSEKKYAQIISSLESGHTDILVGTQIVTKGFDFSGVRLVGILNADNMLNYPDFRAGERAFQIMMQVAGRAGRTDDAGEVVIQTSEPDNVIIRQVMAGDYQGMVRSQMAERSQFRYPPYCRLVLISLSQEDKTLLDKGAVWLASRLRKALGSAVFGPHPPAVERISNVNIMSILIKIEMGASPADVKRFIAAEIAAMAQDSQMKKIAVNCNVDPQ